MAETFSLSEAAAATGRSRVTMRRYLDANRFPGAFRDAAGTWRVPRVDLDALGLLSQRDETPADTGPEDLGRRLAVAEALAAERLRTIEALTAAVEGLQETLRAALRRSGAVRR